MSVSIDIQRLMEVANAAGALSGVNRGYGIGSKEASLTLSTMAGMAGCCGLFEMCGDNDLLSLTIDAEPFLDWLSWRPNNECNQFVKLLTYVGPQGTYNDSEGTGAAAACDDAAGVEFGTCEILLPDKGRIKRAGPVRDLTENNRRLCDEQPLYSKDGQVISDELMWSVTMAGMALKQDLKRMVVTGNAATANQFSGLQTLVNTGYRNARDGSYCTSMDSYVLNWGGNAMTYAYNGTHNLIDYLIDIVRRIRQRAMYSNLGGIAVGDMALVMPSFLRDCLLDAFTCWSVCPGAQYNEANLNTFEARTFRNTLNGGTYGMGQIFIDGVQIPVITYDWLPLTSAAPYFTGDIYVLTRRIGNVPVFYGQYIDMRQPASRFAEESGTGHYRALDGGRFLAYWKTDNECVQNTVVMRPNLYLSAPWAQARIYGVACQRPLQPLSPDPTQTYYAETNLGVAYCPEDYLTDAFGNDPR